MSDQQIATVAPAVRRVTVKGKEYVIAGAIHLPGEYGYVTVVVANVSYWGTRDGKAFGPVRGCGAYSKPGTIGHAIWTAVTEGVDLEPAAPVETEAAPVAETPAAPVAPVVEVAEPAGPSAEDVADAVRRLRVELESPALAAALVDDVAPVVEPAPVPDPCIPFSALLDGGLAWRPSCECGWRGDVVRASDDRFEVLEDDIPLRATLARRDARRAADAHAEAAGG